MADELQGVARSGSWWCSTARFSDTIDGPLASCSTSVNGDLGGVFGWSPAVSEVAADGSLGCFSNSPASCITFQDSQTLQLSDHMGSRPAMDTSTKISVCGFSSSSVDHWSQSFLSESPEIYPMKDTSQEFFTDPSSSETAMNNIQLLYSFESPLLEAEARPSCLTQFPEILKASQPRNFLSNSNTTLDVDGNSAYFSLQDRQFMKSSLIESITEQVSDSSYQSVLKKARIETPSPLTTFKVRKEKLGDRITALQQLVSPFGKTDTASVLYEAIEYIKFLHEQVRTLSSPYFRNGIQINTQQSLERANEGKSRKPELRSRGLCLVPISSTFAVACSEIPAIDFWAPPAFDLNYI